MKSSSSSSLVHEEFYTLKIGYWQKCKLTNKYETMKKLFIGALALAGVLAGPALTYAQMYAYVDVSGDVRMVDSTDANTAIRTAPSIHPRSGVMILDSTADQDVVGDDVIVR